AVHINSLGNKATNLASFLDSIRIRISPF
ncbi:hypothetical protein LINPERHAP1_LOCUS31054, partial [Linum perenne]